MEIERDKNRIVADGEVQQEYDTEQEAIAHFNGLKEGIAMGRRSAFNSFLVFVEEHQPVTIDTIQEMIASNEEE